jgi:hypothetical protein
MMVWCCCRLSYRWRLGRSLVYQCLLGMVDTKAPHRRHTTQQQHSHQPVTKLRLTITTSPRLQNITPQITLPRATSSKILITTPRLPSATPPSHRSITRMLPQLTTPRFLSIILFLATTPRFQLITPPKRLNTTPSRPITTPIRLQIITPQLMLPRATTPQPRCITLPQARQL